MHGCRRGYRMGQYLIYALNGGVYLKSLSYGGNDVADAAASISSELESFGIVSIDPGEITKAVQDTEKAEHLLKSDPPADFPGRCWVEIKDDEGVAYISVTSPLGNGSGVDGSDIRNEISKAGAGEFLLLEDEITSAIGKAKNADEPYTCKIAERRDAVADVEISQDNLEVFLTTKHPHGGAQLTVETIKNVLNEKEIKFGILDEEIERIVNEGEEVSKVLIARGKEPVSGEDGRIEYHFDAFMEKTGPRIDEQDIANFKELGLFESVKPGEILATRIPPTAGEDGTNVLGNPIPATPGKDVSLPVGKNTEEGDDSNALVATCEGQPKLVSGKVTVDEVLTVKGDIDLSTGNIDFVGSVVIHGAISSGFKIKAGDSVTCLDVVEGAEIEAVGDVILKWGMKGQSKGKITAGGNVTAKFLETCSVKAGGSVIVEEFILGSQVRATSEIICIGSKGWVAGGHLSAGRAISCKMLGNEMGIKTIVEVGIKPQLRDEYEVLKARLGEIVPRLNQMVKTLEQLEELHAKGPLDETKSEFRNKLQATIPLMDREYQIGRKRLAEIAEILQATHEGQIAIAESAHPGVHLTIGHAQMQLHETWGVVTFTSGGDEVRTSVPLS